jgi:hypothetical protein
LGEVGDSADQRFDVDVSRHVCSSALSAHTDVVIDLEHRDAVVAPVRVAEELPARVDAELCSRVGTVNLRGSVEIVWIQMNAPRSAS